MAVTWPIVVDFDIDKRGFKLFHLRILPTRRITYFLQSGILCYCIVINHYNLYRLFLKQMAQINVIFA